MTSSLRQYTPGLGLTGGGYYSTQADVPGQGGLSFKEIYRVTQGSHLVTPTTGDNVSLADFDTTFDGNFGWVAVGGTTAGDEIRLYGGDLADSNRSVEHWDGRPRPRNPTISALTPSTYSSTHKRINAVFGTHGAYGNHLTYLRVGDTSTVSLAYPSSFDTSLWGSNTQWIVPKFTWVCCFSVRRTWPVATGSSQYGWQAGYRYVNSGS